MNKFNTSSIQIWFLDDDLQKSAQYLNNRLLFTTIKGCIQALIATRFYFIGIRSKKFYKHYFDKDHRQMTMDKFFPLWPFDKPPIFMNYDSRQSKWTRKCAEHVNYIRKYLELLCNEYEYRYGKMIFATKFLDWLDNDAPELKIPYAGLSRITLEWKSIKLQYRNKNIIQSYRDQYRAFLENNGIDIKDFTNRDIPEFLLAKNSENEKWLK